MTKKEIIRKISDIIQDATVEYDIKKDSELCITVFIAEKIYDFMTSEII